MRKNIEISRKSIAGIIDHTLLKPEASEEQISRLCHEAIKYHFASVCINPCYVRQCAGILQGSGVNVCTVIGFPLGAAVSATKAFEVKRAIEDGAAEVDMVVNIGMVKSGKWENVRSDIEAVVTASEKKALVKVIIETCLLTDEEKVKVCLLAREAGADFVKTSTGFSTGGATAEDVSLMRKTVGENMGVKASGGIHTAQEAAAMVRAGADRLGVSASIAIIEGFDTTK